MGFPLDRDLSGPPFQQPGLSVYDPPHRKTITGSRSSCHIRSCEFRGVVTDKECGNLSRATARAHVDVLTIKVVILPMVTNPLRRGFT